MQGGGIFIYSPRFASGSPFKLVIVWDAMEKRFCRRLSKWKRQYIPNGGRLMLIRSTLLSMLVSNMSLFVIPTKELSLGRWDFGEKVAFG